MENRLAIAADPAIRAVFTTFEWIDLKPAGDGASDQVKNSSSHRFLSG